jgi:hypothetical protein
MSLTFGLEEYSDEDLDFILEQCDRISQEDFFLQLLKAQALLRQKELELAGLSNDEIVAYLLYSAWAKAADELNYSSDPDHMRDRDYAEIMVALHHDPDWFPNYHSAVESLEHNRLQLAQEREEQLQWRIETAGSVAELCAEKGVFYRELPPYATLDIEGGELARLRKEVAAARQTDNFTLAVHQVMLSEREPHYHVVSELLKQGLFADHQRFVVTDRFSTNYLRNAIDRDPNDLVVVMAVTDSEITWYEADRTGRRSGQPKVIYNDAKYGAPPLRLGLGQLTHIPPEKIVGFYYIKSK